MTVHAAKLSDFPIVQRTTLLIDGQPQAGDMLRIEHDNGSHTAAFIDVVDDGSLELAIQRDVWRFQPELRDGHMIWIAG